MNDLQVWGLFLFKKKKEKNKSDTLQNIHNFEKIISKDVRTPKQLSFSASQLARN